MTSFSTALGGKFASGITPESLVASMDVTGIVIFSEPSNEVAVPVAAPLNAIVLAVSSVVAVPAFPVIVVCAGCTWSPRAKELVSEPTAAVPAAFGVVPDALA